MHFSSLALYIDMLWLDLIPSHFAFKFFSVHNNFKEELIQVFETFGLLFV